MREALITRRRIDGEKVEDIEQQLDRDAYESAEEADDDDVLAAMGTAIQDPPREPVGANARGGNGSSLSFFAATNKRLSAVSATAFSWFLRPTGNIPMESSG